MEADKLKGLFSLAEFDGLYVVKMFRRNSQGGSYTRYFARFVMPKDEAIKHFLRWIGAE